MGDRTSFGHVFPSFSVLLEARQLLSFAAAVGESSPLYVDEVAARQAGYRSLPVPPTFLFGHCLEPGEPFPWFAEAGLDLPRVLHGEQSFTYHAAACAGDRLVVVPRITGIHDKKEGRLRVVVRESRISTPEGTLVAELRSVFIQPMIADHAPSAARTTLGRGAPHIRPTLPVLGVPPITRQTLAAFAGASGDRNPLHLDPDFARRAGHDDVIAQGMLSMAYLGRLLTSWAPQRQLLQFRARFTGVTRLGDAPLCSGQVVRAFADGGKGRQLLTLQVSNQHGQQTLTGEALLATTP
jgi:acyl dehydratase